MNYFQNDPCIATTVQWLPMVLAPISRYYGMMSDWVHIKITLRTKHLLLTKSVNNTLEETVWKKPYMTNDKG